tara:strand:- start:1050 stop:3527 length:2478 start_codon:yes stop_codon:yes gene_type:complete
MASISEYIIAQGKQVKNQQKLLSYYGELFEFYNDKLPDNKYIYYLDENPYTEPFSTVSPEVFNFFSAGTKKLSMLTPYVRIFKKFQNKKKKIQKLEFPFENKTDFESFKDPVGYVGGKTAFISERFMGPIAGLTSLDVSYKGIGGKGAMPTTTHVVHVNLSIELQDIKLLFKKWHSTESLQYKDIFGQPMGGEHAYHILVELGYNVPDDFDIELTQIAKRKLVLDLYPLAPRTNLTYNADGSATLSTQMTGHATEVTEDINLLDAKYYQQIKKKNNMLVIDEEKEFSVAKYEEEINKTNDLKKDALTKKKKDIEKENSKPSDKSSGENNDKKLQKKAELMRRQVQLAKNAGAIPATFPFLSALYEAGKMFYIEMDNDRYKSYMQKIADGIPLDLSKINAVPKRKQKIKLEPADLLKKSKDQTDYFAGSLRIRSFNNDEPTTSKFEKVKFFYFGDLVDVILNSKNGGGAGQDLDKLGENEFKLLLGPTVWVKNKKTRKIYNIANTPISLDMFLFELNKEIFTKDRKRLSLREFFAVFMKRFFDIVVLSSEKQKTGTDQQQYTGKIDYLFDKDKVVQGGKFLRTLYNYMPTVETRDTMNFLFVTTILNNKKITKKTRKKRNVPILYIGGPDRGPLIEINFSVIALPALATRTLMRQYNVNKGASDSIGEVGDDSILITAKTKATVTLKGNPFLHLGDFVLIDTRFADGGFFQQSNNLIFFTGYFYIYQVTHTLKGNVWNTQYEMNWQEPYDTPTYNAYGGDEIPKHQNISLTEEAKADRLDKAAVSDTQAGKADPPSPSGKNKSGTTSSAEKGKLSNTPGTGPRIVT